MCTQRECGAQSREEREEGEWWGVQGEAKQKKANTEEMRSMRPEA